VSDHVIDSVPLPRTLVADNVQQARILRAAVRVTVDETRQVVASSRQLRESLRPITPTRATDTDAALEALATENRQLRVAMESRAVIEQAKGIIMGATHRHAEAAFDLLREQSQRQNRKLRDVAVDIVKQMTAQGPGGFG
jgi:hypothetical protein